MVTEIKYLIFSIIIIIFVFFTGKFYFSEIHKKKSYRSLLDINYKINSYSQRIPVLEDDTKNIIEYIENTQNKKKKKFYFWELLGKNDR